ncbi:MAG: TRAP transporter permease, partial [Betaproteobacteria bacterium]
MTVLEPANPSRRIVDPENPAVGVGELPGLPGRVVFFAAIAFCFFQIITAAFSPLSSIVLRSVHVGFLLFLTFMLFRVGETDRRRTVPWHDWMLAIMAFALGLYHWVFEADLIQRAGQPNTADIVVGSVVILLVFEAARRIMGWSLPLICAVFIPYALFGRSLPSFLSHRGFAYEQVVDQLYLGTEGIYGVPTFVSATYIFLFILFGAFLERAGMIQLFNDVALGLVGHQKGGPAKVAVISSGLMGTINGSAIANVLTTGQFTIPLMIRFGYSRAFAGAVEATASMGGQIMPPVMGAVAFIMAETIGVPYYEIALAALIPALLYYASAFWMVHLEAGRRNLVGMPKHLCPNAWRAVVGQWHLLLPLIALVLLLFSGYTPLFAGTIGLAMTALLILGNTATLAMSRRAFRFAFWIGLGSAAALLSRVIGLRVETTALILVLALVVVGLFLRDGRTDLRRLLAAMAEGAKAALGVGVACALVGTLIGVCTLTGVASDLARMVLGVAENNMLLALIMTMVACLVLGTGLPTIPTYIITSATVAPALLQLGVPLIVSHMFCFYFGIMADLTPPVALAALAAQAIANASHMKIGFIATRIALAGYVIPFMTVYSPALMLQGGTWLETAYVVGKAVLAIMLWGAAATGWLFGPMAWAERALATAAAFLLVIAVPLTDEAGFVLAIAVLAVH